MKPIAFGNYTLLRRLATGGMAELFLARSHGLAGTERLVVLKLVASQYAEDKAFVEMFEDEVRITTTLTHPHIGQVYEVGEVDQRYYLAMEHLHGKDLRGAVRKSIRRHAGGIPPALAASIGAKICAALEYAHKARGLDGKPLNIIHRDVSPSNIMLTFSGTVKLLDFGIAIAANRSTLTQPGRIKGKMRYLAPEQLDGRKLDHRLDLFMLGITLWEATIGRHLFQGKTDKEVYKAISAGQVTWPSDLVSDYPPGLEAIIMKALAHDPDHRFATALDMQEALEQFCESVGGSLSDRHIARLLQELFEVEYSAWTEAQRAGKSLLEHLLETSKAGDRDLGEFFTSGDDHMTIPELSDSPSPQSGASLVSSILSEEKSKTSPKKTVLFGELGSDERPNSDQLVKPQASSVGPITLGRRSAVPTRSVKHRGPTGPIKPRRRTGNHRAAGTGSSPAVQPRVAGPADQPVEAATSTKKTVMDSGYMAPTILEVDEEALKQQIAEVAATKDPQISDAPQTSVPETEDPKVSRVDVPVIGSDPVIDGEQPSTRKGVKPSGETPKARRPRTGDWSVAQSADKRPGTHPYFQEEGGTIRKKLPDAARSMVDEGTDAIPQRRTTLIIAVLLLVALGCGIAAAMMIGGDDPAPDTPEPKAPVTEKPPAVDPPPQPKKPDTPDNPARRLTTLSSVPSGATVFGVANGQELGKTPLRLDLQGYATTVELHLDGYLPVKRKLTPETEQIVVRLQRKAEKGQGNLHKGSNSKELTNPFRSPRRKRRPPRDDLKSPFD